MSALPVSAPAGRPSRAKAMRLPSGDHAGARSEASTPGPASVMRWRPVPSAFTTYSLARPSANLTKAILDAFGDHAGSVSPGSEVSRVAPVPSGFMTYSPPPGPPRENAIGPFRGADAGAPVGRS